MFRTINNRTVEVVFVFIRVSGYPLHELAPILEDLEREGKIGINGNIVFIL
jgi:hypothetical protein